MVHEHHVEGTFVMNNVILTFVLQLECIFELELNRRKVLALIHVFFFELLNVAILNALRERNRVLTIVHAFEVEVGWDLLLH